LYWEILRFDTFVFYALLFTVIVALQHRIFILSSQSKYKYILYLTDNVDL